METAPSTNGKKERTGAAVAIPPPEPPRIDYTTHLLAIREVYESPLNPRKRFVDLDELAADIQKRGLIEPLVVRKRRGGGYELAAGARRFRAAKIASLAELPCQIRELSDAELLELAIAENGKRDDLHPLEEAEGLEKLRIEHGRKPEDLALQLGKSLSHVYQRLKLLSLCPEAKKMFLDGGIDTAVAVQLARVPSSDLQKQAMKKLCVDSDFQKPTQRQALEIIQKHFMLRLIDAPFDRANPLLVPAAGACGTCPKRTGMQPELFADVKSGDLCTDPSCFESKSKAGWATRMAAAKSLGAEVLKEVLPEWASTPRGYVLLSEKPIEDKKQRTYRQLLKTDMPKLDAIVRREDGTVLELYKESAVRKKLTELGHRFAQPKPAPKPKKTTGPRPTTPAERELEEKIQIRQLESVMTAVAVAGAKTKPNAAFWRLLVMISARSPELVLEHRGLKGKLENELAKMKEEQLRGFLLEDFIRDNCYDNTLNAFEHQSYDAREMREVVDFLGVDVKAIAKAAKDVVLAEAKKTAGKQAAKGDDQKHGGKKTTKKGRAR